MKVAIIAFYTMDSTIPLSKYLNLAGIEVDLYCLLPQGNRNAYVFDFTNHKLRNGFVDQQTARDVMGQELLNYLGEVEIKTFIYPSVNGRIRRYLFQDLIHAFRLSMYLKKKKYDLIHIIHSDDKFWNYLFYFLRNEMVIQTLHEVTSHDSITPRRWVKRLKSLIRENTPIIFNSLTSKERFIKFRNTVIDKPVKNCQLEVIRFGLFETYLSYANRPTIQRLEKKIVILNFGRIVPYKGIRFLVEAVKLLQNEYPIKLVIAGEGEPDFNFEGVNDYKFINRRITNSEIVELIEDCDLVVLPYTSASQSGVVMTVYAFNKPIVASNIDGLKEVIDHMRTGMLVENINGRTLASSIEILLKDENLRDLMSSSIKTQYQTGEYSWKMIAEQTIKFYKKQIADTIK